MHTHWYIFGNVYVFFPIITVVPRLTSTRQVSLAHFACTLHYPSILPLQVPDSQSDSSEDSDESPKHPTNFSAPPIRTAALKSMFPSKSDDASSSLITKTLYSGNIASSRNCGECGALNSRKAKKCQQCKAPIQVNTKLILILHVHVSTCL